jgi:hypothetical protein
MSTTNQQLQALDRLLDRAEVYLLHLAQEIVGITGDRDLQRGWRADTKTARRLLLDEIKNLEPNVFD